MRIAFIFCIEASLKLLTHRYLVGTGRYHYKRLFIDDKGKLGILQAYLLYLHVSRNRNH
jgi:hypothetical protein